MRISLFAFFVAGYLSATPTVGTPTASPAIIQVSTTTMVTMTVKITDPTFIPGGANLLQVDSAGNSVTILGVMHDDGLNGDAVAGDGILTLQVPLRLPTPGLIYLEVSAAFKGVLLRVRSNIIQVAASVNQAPVITAGPNQTFYVQPIPVAITEYPIATPASTPELMTRGPDDNVWFTERLGDKIGKITPTGVVKEFPVTAGSNPYGITAGPDGNLWFTEIFANKIGKITPAGVITEFLVPSSGSQPAGITLGPDNNLWFTENSASKIGRITPAGVIAEFSIQTRGSTPYGIAAGPDGNLWFAERGGNNIGKITPAGVITEFSIPTGGSGPVGIIAGPDGNLWFTENFGKQVGRITPVGVITEFPIPSGNLSEWITSGPDGNIWFTEGGADRIGRITTTGTITEFPTAAGSFPEGITEGADGSIWFTESNSNKIGKIPLFQTTTTLLTGTVTDDGLPVGATLSAAWSLLSGPAVVSFAAPVASFPDIAGQVNPVTTSATFNAPGRYTISLTGNDSQLSASSSVTITLNPLPTLLSVNPNTGSTGQPNLMVAITGQFTHFIQGTTTANFGAGVLVGPITVTNATSLSAPITIAATAAPGPRTVTVTTGTEVVAVPGGFTVISANQPPIVGAGTNRTIPLSFSEVMITEYPLAANRGIQEIVAGSDGNLWFTESQPIIGNNIGRVTPAGVITEFPIPSGSSEQAIAAGPDGNLWFTEYRTGIIGRLTPTGVFTEFPIPSGGSFPVGITTGPDGNLWFTESGKIGRITTAGIITEFPVPVSGSYITAGADGNLWFTNPYANIIGRMTLAGVFTGFSVPTSGGFPYGITAGPDGNVWFAEANSASKIGRITPAGVFTEFPTPTRGSSPLFITTGPDGNLWFTEASAIGRITPAGVITEFPVPTAGSVPTGITTGSDGNLWFAEYVGNKIGKANYGVFANPVTQSLTGSIADDGVPVGATLTTMWTETSGPGPVSFGNPTGTFPDVGGISNPVSTSATFSALGTYLLGLTGSDSLLSNSSSVMITVVPPQFPTILSVNPSTGQQGQQVLSVNITGQFTNFLQGTTAANFGAGTSVASLTVSSSTTAMAVLNIDPTATVGPRRVTLTTGTEMATFGNGFSVTPGTPILLTVNPNTGFQGQQNLPVTITGQFTHFVQGTTTIDFGSGITVGTVTVANTGSLTAQVTIGSNAALGPRTVTVTTGTEIAVLPAGFTVTSGNQPPAVSVGPNQMIALSFSEVQITEYPGANSPIQITLGPDGNLWFTEYLTNKIGRITLAGVVTEYAVPTSATTNPYAITSGSDGNLWFTEDKANQIGRITPSGVITEFPIPTATARPFFITGGPDGNLWFTENNGNKIGKITPAGLITEFSGLTDVGPNGIVTGPDGNLWFVEQHKVGRITTAGVITEFQVPNPGGEGETIAVGSDGNLWFTNRVEIGRITPVGVITEFAVPTAGIPTAYITSAPDGNLWFVGGNDVGRITSTGIVTEFPVPTPSSELQGIVPGPDGNLWFAERAGNKIGELNFGVFFDPSTATATAALTGSVTDDGLPLGATLTTTWSESAGPSPVSFTTPIATFSDVAGKTNPVTTSATFTSQGTYTLSLTGNDSQISSSSSTTITVNLPQVPTILSVNPNTGQQGQRGLSVNVSGQFTHFLQGTTTASFGSGVTVTSLTVNSPTSATILLNISSTALVGPRRVTLTTGTEMATFGDGFSVAPGTPILLTVNPNSGSSGQQNVSVNITGQFTHFAQGTTTANFGVGIAVAALTVNSPTTTVAVLNIDPVAMVGPRSVTLTTGTEVVTLGNAFSVTAGTPVLLSVNPNSGQQGRSLPVNLTGLNTHFMQGVTQLDFGAGVTASAINVVSPTSLTAELCIAAPTTDQWTPVAAGAQGPSGLSGHSSVYDFENKRMIAFGGSSDNSVWILGMADGIGGTPIWTQVVPPGVGPAPRRLHTAVFDQVTNRMTVYGGINVAGQPLTDIWVLTDANGLGGTPQWIQLSPGTTPTMDWDHTAVFDPASNRMIVFGGCATSQPTNCGFGDAVNDTWVLTNANGLGGAPQWIQLSPVGGPPIARVGHSAVYDGASNRMIIFGGAPEAPASRFSDTWVLTNANGLGGTPLWIQLNPSTPTLGRYNHAAAYNARTNQMVVSSGAVQIGFDYSSTIDGNDTWVLNGANGLAGAPSWVQLSPAGSAPVAREHATAVLDPCSNTIVFVGGQGSVIFADTWWLYITSPGAGPGPKTVTATTNTETVSLTDGFTVQAASTVLTSITPAIGQQGQQNLSVTITGQFTHFVQGTTTANFGAGITVASLAVTSPATATALLSIDQAATLGGREITLTTGSEIASLANGFTVIVANVPAITQVSPNSGPQGQGGPVGIVGQNTHFAQGTTQVDFGAGITVSSISVTCPTCLTAQLQIDSAAAPGPRTVAITTGSEVVTLASGFTVLPGTPILISLNPASGHQGQTFNVTIGGQYTHFAQGTTQVSFGAGVAVTNINVSSATSLTAQLAIDLAASIGTRTPVVTTGTEVVSQPNIFTVQAGVPILQSLNPGGGQQGQQNLSVSITGQFTNFVQGTTQANFGAGITVSSLTVTNSTTATATLNIDPAASFGPRTVTMTTSGEVASFANGFTVSAGNPVLTQVNPSSGLQGQQNLTVTVTGQLTHFVQGTSQVSFGAGITVNTFTVTSSTSLAAQITIISNALVGTRTVTVTTAGEVASLLNAFTVQPNAPLLISTNPGGGQQGQTNLNVTVTGQLTNFVQGTSQVNFGAGITVNSVTVANATSLTAQITISPTASIGLRDLTVTTGTEVATFPNGFSVTAGIPTLQSVNPNTGRQGQLSLSVMITGQFTNFAQGSSQVSFGAAGTGVTVNSVSVTSSTNLTAVVTIASNSLLGVRPVTVTTGTEVASLSNAFNVQTAVNQAPVITIAPSWSVVLPSRLTINYTVTDDGLPLGGSLAASWDTISTPAGATVGYQNQTINSISAGFDTPGTYDLRITASDSQLTVFQDITVTVTGSAIAPPTVSITTPVDGSEVTTAVNVIGSVGSPSLSNWTLQYQAPGSSTYTTLATGTTPIQNGILGTFDPTLLLNGISYIQLTATDTSGQTISTGPLSLIVTRNQKVGNFTVSFNDLSVPVAGLPIQVVRTYDSRRRSIPGGDFSYGWTLDVNTANLAETVPLGNEWGESHSSGLSPYCINPNLAHVMTMTLPDGTTYEFQPTFTPQCQSFVPILQVTVGFTPIGATPPNASLAIAGNNVALVNGTSGEVTFTEDDLITPFDPDLYNLTLPDGRTLQISMQAGLQKMTDLNNNTLTVTPSGIMSSTGKSVTFTRNAAQRITAITDPNGNSINYGFNPVTGDLTGVTDRTNQTTTFAYSSDHLLLTIKDPRGVQPIRNDYDASGRLISHTDAFGNVINYTNNLAARQEVVTDRLGNITVNQYDNDGNVVQVTDALGGITTRIYDTRDNLLTETNALGKTRTYTYDANNNRLTEIDPLGNTSTYTYNSRNQVLTVIDALAHLTTNLYDVNGNLTSTTDPAGNITSYIYNGSGLRTSMTDALQNITGYKYDASGNLTQQTDALGNITNYTFDANGNRLSQTQTRTASSGPETLFTSYQYDPSNRLTQTTYPDGSTTQIQYNSIGKQSITIDQLGRQTSYQYDLMGRLIQTNYPDGTNETTSYDAEGDRIASTDRANRTTTYVYDQLKRLTKTIYPDTTATTTTFDAIGEVKAVVDALGNMTQYAYDDAGRRVTVTDALTHVTTFTYDVVGNQTFVKDANSNTTQYQYDNDNRRVKTIYPDTTSDGVAYDGLGRTTSKTDQAGKTIQFQYDKLGRLTQVTDALNQLTKYAYDEVSNRISQTDANLHTTTFAYDKLGRRIKRTLPLVMSETNAYDLAGNLKTKIDFNGKMATFVYDAMNRLISKTPDASFGAPTVAFTYTATGQRQTMIDASGTTGYAYDLRDRLQSKATPEGTLTYTYDLGGNLASIRSSNTGGTSVNYLYDALNRLSTVTDNRFVSGNTTYTYDNVGNLAGYLYPNGVQSSYAYNQLNRLTNLTISKGSTLASYAYTLGPAGNRTGVVEVGGRQVNYTYDALYRLTGETIAGGSVNGAIGYQYDPVGNRLQRTSTVALVPAASSSYDANDRLTVDTYDNDGNTTASGANAYAYDFENHLTSENGGSVAIVYDGDGNRVAKTVGGATTKYLVDDRNLTGYAQVLEELSSGAVLRVYTYGLNRISQSQASGTSFYGYDGHGSVRLLTNATGAVTDRYDYDAFGNIISQTGTTPNVYLFSGEQNDPSLNLYYLRARYLSQSTGRFWTMDNVEGDPDSPVSLHKYTYVGNEPVLRADPSGNQFDIASVSLEIAITSILLSVPDVVWAPGIASQATVEVHFDRLGVAPITNKPYHHAYLLVRKSQGAPALVFRGGPSSSCQPSAAAIIQDFLGLVGNSVDMGCGYVSSAGSGTPFGPGAPDYPNGPQDDVASAKVPNITQSYNQIVGEFKTAAQKIDSLSIYYHPVSQNSNSFADTLLTKSGLFAPTPPVWSPGWDHILY